MVISIHPSHSQPLVVDSAMESFSYRWLVTMAALGVEPPPCPPVNDANGGEEGRQPGYFIDVDPKAAAPGGGRDSVDDDLEFEFVVPPPRCSPPPADQIISGGLLLPLKGTPDCKEKDKKGAVATSSSADESRALTRSLSSDSWSSTGTMFSSCPSRSSSASSSSSSSSVTPLKPKARRSARPAVPPPVSSGQSPLLPRLPKRGDQKAKAKGPAAAKKGVITLASSIPQKIARLCLCLLAAACRRAAEAVSAANGGSGSSRRDSKAASPAVARRDSSKKKKGRKGVEGLSSAIQWCRADADAVENSIHEAVLHCKRSYSRTD